MYPVELVTERLILREEAIDDARFLFELVRNVEAGKYQTWNSATEFPVFSDEFSKFLEMRHQPVRQHYELLVSIDGKRAGFCGLNVENQEFKRASIAYGYLPSFWGKGIGTEAAGRLMQFGFDELGLVRIQATVHPDNIASHRIAKRVGMKFEGRLSKYACAHGEWRDSLMFARTAWD